MGGVDLRGRGDGLVDLVAGALGGGYAMVLWGEPLTSENTCPQLTGTDFFPPLGNGEGSGGEGNGTESGGDGGDGDGGDGDNDDDNDNTGDNNSTGTLLHPQNLLTSTTPLTLSLAQLQSCC